MEKKQCLECKNDINDIEPLRCGFCDGYMHISQTCCGINSRGLKEPFAQGKLMLLCTACKNELNGRSIRVYIADIQHGSPNMPNVPVSTELPVKVQQLSDIVESLSKKIDNLTSTNQLHLDWPVPTPKTPAWTNRSAKRRRTDENAIVDAPADVGTNIVDLSDLPVPSIAPKANKFWLYLSRLNPVLTDCDVQKISRCLNITDPVDAVRLVPKGKDVANMSFISYKIGLDPDMKSQALDPSSWPVGMLFREFFDRPKNLNRLTIPPPPERME
ncbi:uncharacterized protein LOC128739986 [Sabethes cyaneus]|uniref:uncharacterized protein LOC128739986 n=1 Tax=Sabethes cyaneus TaxID=53552 RepID=UPI00237DD0FF|nr:uncharacterized protein LOC128739986 [Sabethes cyaneus]